MLYTIIVLSMLNLYLIWNLQKIIEIYSQLKPYNISLIKISKNIIKLGYIFFTIICISLFLSNYITIVLEIYFIFKFLSFYFSDII